MSEKNGPRNPSGVHDRSELKHITSAHHELWRNGVRRAPSYPVLIINTHGYDIHKPQSKSSLLILKMHGTVFWQLHVKQRTAESALLWAMALLVIF